MYMIKILHSGDWHLDSPFQGRTEAQSAYLRRELLQIPGKIAAICKEENCDLVLLSGDLFDGAYTQGTFRIVFDALADMGVPVFVSPGNHDFISPDSPYVREIWPENVHIFKKQTIERVEVPSLGLSVYGAGFQSMDCPSLLDDLHAEGLSVGVFHGDPTQANSPYNPVTKSQVIQSGLKYLALGHVHKGEAFQAGDTVCAWPGCPMGRGWDEGGEKGVLIAQLGAQTDLQFVPLDTPRFYDITVDAAEGVGSVLPAVAGDDFYRITLTGESEPIDLDALQSQWAAFPNLTLRDQTVRPLDIWGSLGQDNFEGVYFGMLKDAMERSDDPETVLLAAKLSRKLLEGLEVELP